MEIFMLALLGIAGNAFLIDRLFFNESDDGNDTSPDQTPDTPPDLSTNPEDLPPDAGPDQLIGTPDDDILTDTPAGGGVYGLGGDDLVRGLFDGLLYGGSGDDTLSAYDSTLYGGSGDDDLVLRSDGQGFGGDGDDVLSFFPTDVDTGSAIATGGAGADTFAVIGPYGPNGPPQYESIISDFDPQQDILVVDTTAFNSDILHRVAVTPHVAGNYVDVTLTWQNTDARGAFDTVIRLNGLTDFDPANIHFANDIVDGTYQSSYGILIGPEAGYVTGTSGDDALGLPGEVTFDADTGNDTVTGGDTGSTVGTLGTGDDQFIAGAGQHIVYGSDGNDSYLADAADDPAQGGDNYSSGTFFGGAGNDVVRFLHADQTQNATSAVQYGGAGNDTFSTDAGSGQDITFYGGIGDDVIGIHAGQGAFGGYGADQITVDIGLDVATFGPAQLGYLNPASVVVVNIDPALVGALRTVNFLAVNGFDVVRTDVYAGTQKVLTVNAPDAPNGTGFQLTDPRFTFNRT